MSRRGFQPAWPEHATRRAPTVRRHRHVPGLPQTSGGPARSPPSPDLRRRASTAPRPSPFVTAITLPLHPLGRTLPGCRAHAVARRPSPRPPQSACPAGLLQPTTRVSPADPPTTTRTAPRRCSASAGAPRRYAHLLRSAGRATAVTVSTAAPRNAPRASGVAAKVCPLVAARRRWLLIRRLGVRHPLAAHDLNAHQASEAEGRGRRPVAFVGELSGRARATGARLH